MTEIVAKNEITNTPDHLTIVVDPLLIEEACLYLYFIDIHPSAL